MIELAMLIYSQGQGVVCYPLRFAECINYPKNAPNIELSWQNIDIPCSCQPSSAKSQERNERLEWLNEATTTSLNTLTVLT